MRIDHKVNTLKISAFTIFIFLFFSCKSGDNPIDATDPTPNVMVKPVVKILPATNVAPNSVTVIAWVTPNENDTKISVEYKTSTETNYHSLLLPNSYTGIDSIKVSVDLSNLVNCSEYSFHVKAINAAGEMTSADAQFSTWLVKDYDDTIYHVIKIGTQYWMQENLQTIHYNDGMAIMEDKKWNNPTTGAYCNYNNDVNYVSNYGRLYNWYAINTAKLAPVGWHVSTEAEWIVLFSNLGGDVSSGGKLKSITGWESPNVGATNSTGFSALPGGYRNYNGFHDAGSQGYWWSSTEYDTHSAWTWNLGYDYSSMIRNYNYESDGYSVRCVRDN